jgi:glycosyltransferase involved in cell wall biosynthesis
VNSGIERDFIENEEFITQKARKSHKPIRIATIASLIQLKRIDTVILALQQIEDIDWHYSIIGDGPERQNLEALVPEDIKNKVRFTGYLDRNAIGELLKNIDLFILVSARETFGLVYLEALAKGCIVIGSKGWGIDGVIEHGKNGFLCDSGNVEQLRNTIKYINNFDRSEWLRIIRAGYLTVCNMEEKKISEDYLKAIEKII